MEKLNDLVNSLEIIDFINSINTLSCDDTYNNINNIINKLHNSNIYDFDADIKILAIKNINNLATKTKLIHKCFFADCFETCCYSWCNVIACIDDLEESDAIGILKNLLSNSNFEKNLKKNKHLR